LMDRFLTLIDYLYNSRYFQNHNIPYGMVNRIPSGG